MKFFQVTFRKKRTGPDQPEKSSGPRTGPDADQENFEIRGPDRTRTKKFSGPADRTGRGPRKFLKKRTDEDRRVRGPGGPWIPGVNIVYII